MAGRGEEEESEGSLDEEEALGDRDGEDEDDRTHRFRRTIRAKEMRACAAFTVQEEKQAILAKTHAALAAKCREEHLRLKCAGSAEARQARQSYDKLWEDLVGDLENASSSAASDRKLLNTALSVPDTRCDPLLIARVSRSLPGALDYISDEILANRDIMLNLVAGNGLALGYASHALKKDREVVLAAVSSHCWALAFVEDDDLLRDREVVLSALRLQTQDQVIDIEENQLYRANPPLNGDREIVLEAVRVDGTAISLASAELRQDQDFIVQAMRRAPPSEGHLCYDKAAPRLKKRLTLEEILGAADSALAMAGDPAPVLSIRLEPVPRAKQRRIRGKKQGAGITSCEASMLSGTTFTCSLGATNGEEPGESVKKRPRPSCSHAEPSRACLTVGDLAKLVLAELPQHVQMDPLPDRIFLVFDKINSHGDAVSVTPWDWNRPLAQFV